MTGRPCAGSCGTTLPADARPLRRFCSRSCGQRAWRETNREHVKAYHHEWYGEHREDELARGAQRRADDPEWFSRWANREDVAPRLRVERQARYLGEDSGASSRAAARAQRAADPETARAVDRRYREAHPDRRAAGFARWAGANRARRAETQRRREARRLGRTVERVDYGAVLNRDGWTCQLCHEPLDREASYWLQLDGRRTTNPAYPTVDHRMPLARGGEHTYANVQAAHLGCNVRKATRLEDESPSGPYVTAESAEPRATA